MTDVKLFTRNYHDNARALQIYYIYISYRLLINMPEAHIRVVFSNHIYVVILHDNTTVQVNLYDNKMFNGRNRNCINGAHATHFVKIEIAGFLIIKKNRSCPLIH